jgi:hypothetical protein
MTTKKCSKCEEVKPVAEYHKNKSSKDGLYCACKTCTNKRNRKYDSKNKDSLREANKKWYEKNKELIREKQRDYESKNKREISRKKKLHYQKNKEAINARHRKYNKENRDACNQRTYKWRAKKYKEQGEYRLVHNLRCRTRRALNGNCKADTTKALLGCTYEEARAHIEAQFTQGMSWDKMGAHGIHIDHIRPCASFDLSDPEQQRECFHYTNLQPLWANDNLRKGDKW